jgi:polyhydroxyalkanoate synthesis regulator phasin
MSEDTIDSLKAQIENGKKGVDGLLAQLDAHKQLFNETLNASLSQRTHNILLTKQNQELINKVHSLNDEVAALKAKVASLEAAVAPSEAAA